MNQTQSNVEINDRDIIIRRELNAPREAVWAAWTQPQQVEQWFGPEGFTTTVEALELKPGGASKYVMHGPDGGDYPCSGVFREVVVPERIVTTDEFGEGFEDVYDGDLPQGIILTVTFQERGDKTEVTLLIAHPSSEERKKHEDMGVVGGWNSTLDCLEKHLQQQ